MAWCLGLFFDRRGRSAGSLLTVGGANGEKQTEHAAAERPEGRCRLRRREGLRLLFIFADPVATAVILRVVVVIVLRIGVVVFEA